ERGARVSEVLDDLGLTERRDVQVSALSGGQQKRVSIGVELITRPSLFFLDEPTSGLDPGTETLMMQLMRNLADQGRTIILITHATKNVMLADKVIFLVRGGRVAWFGPPDEALTYFDQYRTERERRAEDMSFDRIYSILEDPAIASPEEWAARFRKHQAHARYIAGPLELDGTKAAADTSAPVRVTAPSARKRTSGMRQFLILSARNLNILLRDKFSLALMLATAPLLGSLDFIIARRDMFDAAIGDPSQVFLTLLTLTVIALFVGAMSQMREIVKETDIYKRERLVNLQLLPYVLSKVWVAVLLALYQSAAYLLIRYIAVDMPGNFGDALLLYVTVLLATMAGMMLGLFVSAVSPNPATAPLLTVLLLIPQMIFSGGLLPIKSFGPVGEVISYAISGRWALEALITQAGVGHDVATDACWLLPEDEREALTAAEKADCTCMGEQLYDRCYFPGLQANYLPALDEPEPVAPVEPEAPGTPPPEPAMPPEPVMPPEPAMLPEPELPPEPERPEPPELILPAPPPPPEQPEVFTPLNQLKYNIALKEWTDALSEYNENVNARLYAHNEAYTASVESYLDALQTYQADAQATQEAYSEEVRALQKGYSSQVESIQRAYNDDVTTVREAYSADIAAYQAKVDVFQQLQEQYRQEVERYQEDLGRWQRDRSTAIAAGEGVLATFWESHGSTFNVNVTNRWMAQGIIIMVLFGLILVFQKRKDVI
ncbi:MAG: ABC transporter permease, partial [Anaerolineales bacterium]